MRPAPKATRIISNPKPKQIHSHPTTLTFAIKARTVVVRTDSKYLVDLATQWMPGWKRRGWTRARGEPVANLDLVQRLDDLMRRHFVHWEWVKAHAGEPGNERVDGLANLAMDAVEAGQEPTFEARWVESPVSLGF